MGDAFSVPADAVQPSQLHLSDRKFATVAEWFDFDDPDYDPLLVLDADTDLDRAPAIDRRSVDADYVLVDGHTRAFVVHLAGETELRVRYHDDPALDAYATCVEWCREAEVADVADLAGRLLDHETYGRRWIDRCHATFGE